MLFRVPVGRRLAYLAVMLLWVALVLYPDPRDFFTSLKRLARPPVNPSVVSELAAQLPDDPAAVEAFSQAYVRYDNPWDLYGLPWYFPNVEQVLADKAGDCQAEAVLTASILAAKGIPYTMRYSFDHVWVDYPGKKALGLEDPSQSFVADAGSGWFARWPDKVPLQEIVQQRVQFHWYPMPTERKAALLGGLLLVAFVGEGILIWLGQRLVRGARSLIAGGRSRARYSRS